MTTKRRQLHAHTHTHARLHARTHAHMRTHAHTHTRCQEAEPAVAKKKMTKAERLAKQKAVRLFSPSLEYGPAVAVAVAVAVGCVWTCL